VHEYADGGLALFHGPRCLERWPAPAPAAEPEMRPAAWTAYLPAWTWARACGLAACRAVPGWSKAVNSRATCGV